MGVTSANTSWCRLDIADQTVDEAAETRKEHEKVGRLMLGFSTSQ
jgi:hypothetical protein